MNMTSHCDTFGCGLTVRVDQILAYNVRVFSCRVFAFYFTAHLGVSTHSDVAGTSYTVCAATVHIPCHLWVDLLSCFPATKWHNYKIWEVCYTITMFTVALPPIRKCLNIRTKKKKTVPTHPSKNKKNKQSQKNLENRDKDSKLPVEEDAGIHSTSFSDGRTGLPTLCFLLCRPLSSVSMQSHGLDQGKKYNVQHLPELLSRPRLEGGGSQHDPPPPICSSMKWEWHKIT